MQIPDKTRIKESVRPIYWSNRSQSYAARTVHWDEYPNGRWGDSRSPGMWQGSTIDIAQRSLILPFPLAFGELDGYGMSIKMPKEEARKLWPEPQSEADLFNLFVSFCRGEVRYLPWCEDELRPESGLIQDKLIELNSRGFLTINSQPSVNGVSSNDKVFGWGPKSGYVYQKVIELEPTSR